MGEKGYNFRKIFKNLLKWIFDRRQIAKEWMRVNGKYRQA
jgi:hypothetical protein